MDDIQLELTVSERRTSTVGKHGLFSRQVSCGCALLRPFLYAECWRYQLCPGLIHQQGGWRRRPWQLHQRQRIPCLLWGKSLYDNHHGFYSFKFFSSEYGLYIKYFFKSLLKVGLFNSTLQRYFAVYSPNINRDRLLSNAKVDLVLMYCKMAT